MTSEQKKNKQLLFLVAQPRSGNTLFASIINQNPEIACTPNSITLEIMKDLFLLKQTDVFQNYPDHKSLDNVFFSPFELRKGSHKVLVLYFLFFSIASIAFLTAQ